MKRGIILLCGLIFILSSCNNEEILIEQNVKESDSKQALKGKPDKITICHYEAVTDTWKQMEIHPNALENHLAHGDIYGEFCPDYRLDEDNDGVTNDLEACPDTPAGEPVDAEGCAESQKDDDGDGVMNDVDLCLETPVGEEVDADGCPTSLYTSIPDPNFEQALIDQGIDSEKIKDGRVLTADVSGQVSLVLISKNITDLTGIENFVSLNKLIVMDNNIEFIDVSNLIELTVFVIKLNRLVDLDVSNNTKLQTLDIQRNLISTIDVDNNNDLTFLNISENNITSLNLINNPKLEYLTISHNPITNLNLTNVHLIKWFIASLTQIESIDLSANSNLTKLYCGSNSRLTTLNIKNGNNINVTDFFVQGNFNLTCIQVDDATWSSTNWTQIDAQTSFSEDCGY